MTGLSGAGKSTLAFSLEQYLFRKGYQVYVLDGDNVRHGLCSDLGFAPEDRVENIRRVGHASALFAQAGFLVLTAFISPYRADRDRVRTLAPELFHEIFVDADLPTCEQRDPKGLYKRARRGEIDEFTGVSAPYEAPVLPELRVDTSHHSVEECLAQLNDYIASNFALSRKS
jgi:bifunctional enzyme CysN/CysC